MDVEERDNDGHRGANDEENIQELTNDDDISEDKKSRKCKRAPGYWETYPGVAKERTGKQKRANLAQAIISGNLLSQSKQTAI